MKYNGRMNIETERFGNLEVAESDLIEMDEGILGFPEQRLYARIPHAEGSPFHWLQSATVASLAFVITDPNLFFPDYAPEIADSDVASIGITEAAQAEVRVLVTIPEDITQMSANLIGPIIINVESRKARQVIAANEGLTTKHLLIPGQEQ